MRSVKIAMIGCSGVGKSSLTSQFVSRQFIPNHQVTAGSEGYFFRTEVNGEGILIEIEDTKGFDTTDADLQLAAPVASYRPRNQENEEDDQKEMRDSGSSSEESDESSSDEEDYAEMVAFRHVKGSELFLLGEEKERSGFLVVFDLTRPRTLVRADRMIEKIHKRIDGAGRVPLLLVGNKADCKRTRRVTPEEAWAIARKRSCQYMETSARINSGVTAAFLELAERILIAEQEREDAESRRKNGYDPTKIACEEIRRPERDGYLVKRGHLFKTWKRRWFVLKRSMLWYFANPKSSSPRGVLRLEGCQVRQGTVQDDQKVIGRRQHVFVISLRDSYSLYIQAPDEAEMLAWIEAISHTVE